jgi:FlaA1/EpsC-like NDP-sugar epimerase
LIIGAGESGQFLARQLQTHSQRHRYELVGFVDDDPAKLGLRLHGVSILGDRQAILQLVAERKVGLIIITIHNIPGSTLREILSICLNSQAQVKIQPDFLKLMDNPKEALPLRDITPTDLLGRQPHQIDETACRELIWGKVILVTGAAGSIGSELCHQLLNFQPRQLLMLDNNETGLHNLTISCRHSPLADLEAEERPATEIKSIIADITNASKLEQIFKTYRPQIIFHAAAYKHVPLMEQQPDEAVRVNVLGTKIVSKLAARYAAECFVFISTDKAINPSSIMGATKRLGEMMIMNGVPGSTLFTAVRFGNVLGSRGSVVPTFTRQIELGGPVTVTHPEMTRYFMSVSEAASLVIQAATLTEGKDIFMLDMGQRIRIADLAHKMIRLRGLRPGQDIAIEYTGIRPGEKLYEEFLAPDEE